MLLKDLRFASRLLRRNPAYSALAILTMALGIGASAAIFSVVNGVLLRPLPYPDADRIVVLWTRLSEGPETSSGPDFLDWRAQSQSFESLTAVARSGANLTGDGEPERVISAAVSPEFFSVFGVRPVLGPGFSPEEWREREQRAVILTDGLWRRRFGADPNIVGRNIQVNGIARRVAGVMPPGFVLPVSGDILVPLTIDLARQGRRNDFLFVAARMKPGVSRQAAQSEMDAIAARLSQQYPNTNLNIGVDVVAVRQEFVGKVERALLLLLGAVACLLLIACANVANLMLARAAARSQEMSVRAALGAGRAQLLRQLLAESVLLSLAGGLAGTVLARLALKPLLAMTDLPRSNEVAIDLTVLAVTFCIATLTGILFGMAPALYASRADLHAELRLRGAGSGAGLRGGLLAAQVALSLMLLIAAGLLARSFAGLVATNPGFRTDRMLTAYLQLPRPRYPAAANVLAFFDQLKDRVRALPGVESVALVGSLPLSGGGSNLTFAVIGRPDPPPGMVPAADVNTVSPEYFATMGIPVLRGRGFSGTDQANTTPVAIVNRTFAEKHFRNDDPIGKQIRIDQPVLTIVGVVNDVRHWTLDKRPVEEIFLLHAQNPRPAMSVIVRTIGAPVAVAGALREQVRLVDKDQPVARMRTMEDVFGESVSARRFTMTLVAAFAGLAMLLAAVGVYAVLAYAVERRTREIGIRIAVGAARADVVRLTLRDGLAPVGLGIAVGRAGAAALTRVLEGMLYNVSAADPLTWLAVTAVLMLAAGMATIVPALRAAQVDPIDALRHE
ncbi:MAG: ABC transporter permease [Bryobacteraceae bacterium]|nr:ABC transporter permease [Bryobacteraceae bacterium]